MGRSIGHGMREFKDAVTGKDEPEGTEIPPPAEHPPAEPERVETERVSR
jgi:hypothetical protein